MFIWCCGGRDTVLRKILDRGHPLGLAGSMWAAAGAEQPSREIKKVKSFAPTPRNHMKPTRGLRSHFSLLP